MSFDNSSSFAHWQSSLASRSDRSSPARPARVAPSAWNPPPSHPGSRRGLTPLATANLTTTSLSPPPSSPFTSFQAGATQPPSSLAGHSVTSPRSRTVTPVSTITITNTAPAEHLSASGLGPGGGGGVGGVLRSNTYSPAVSGTNVGSPTTLGADRPLNLPGSATATSGSFSSISIAQVNLLLDTISEKEGKAKWDLKVEQIRKLIQSNGMEVYTKYFRRLLSSNAPQIFSVAGTNNNDNGGSSKILQEEMRKVLSEAHQAQKIVETIATSEGDIYRDFDLATFIRFFELDPVANGILALAFRSCARADLRSKAESYLKDIAPAFLESLARRQKSNESLSAPVIAIILESVAASPQRSVGTETSASLLWAVFRRFDDMQAEIPPEVLSAVQLLNLPAGHQNFLQRLQKLGPKATATPDDAESLLASIGLDSLDESEVANALLFMALSIFASQFRPDNFISAVRSKSRVKRLDWQKVIKGFDVPDLRVTSPAFLRLFNGLLLVATEEPDLQLDDLWGGHWENTETQLSFLGAYLECSPNDIDVSRIPRFRPSVPPELLQDVPDAVRRYAESELRSHVASAAAMTAFFDLVLDSETAMRTPPGKRITAFLMDSHVAIILLSAAGASDARRPTYEQFIARCFSVALADKELENRAMMLDALFRLHPKWVFDQCSMIFVGDPLTTEVILNCATEMGWVDHFLTYWHTPLTLDMACVLHRDGKIEIDQYLREAVSANPRGEGHEIGAILNKYLRIKADDEYRTQRQEQSQPRCISLAVRTVFALLIILDDYLTDPEILLPTQRTCLATYPRLMNYGQEFDDIIDRAGEQSNKLPEEVDQQMSDLFGQMYREELSIQEVLIEMRRLKSSRDPHDQDLFACIIHGLFDEYHCFHEYPEEALQKTAMLFGGIINYQLVRGIPLKVGLGLLLEAVRDYQTDEFEAMYKFGNEALEQLMDRLPEWPEFCRELVHVPALQGRPVRQRAEEILHDRDDDADANGINGEHMGLTNGGIDDFLTDNMSQAFRALHADPPPPGRFSDPDEATQEKILFVINNLSNDNMGSKLADLQEALKEEHYQWFAAYIVEQRARVEPNNQDMYLRLLDMIDDKALMAEILRETYVSAIKMMNAEATAQSATERAHLKNLGGWLGSLTLARDKPIKHRNIYFVELLVEGYDTQRLPVVIPFTCKVLVQGAKSTVFTPPNPWLMEIIRLLMELYHFAELKLNLKFEIEVLCKDLDVKHMEIDPAMLIRDRPAQLDDEMTNLSGLPDGLDGFDELSLTGINRGARERLSTDAIMANLPKLDEVLKYPPPSGAAADYDTVKNIVYRAFDQAIQEIIAPVVERSITIASISTAQLMQKDFVTEVDVDKYQKAAQQMVKSLAGSLALVTCKEPLRMSVTNYLRRPVSGGLPESFVAEGAIMMCVNDNLDMACSFVESAAADRAVPEIDLVIEPDLEERRRHLAEKPDQAFVSRNVSRWSMYLPDPYKQAAGGLNEAQYAVYEDFARQVRGVGTNHMQNPSTDSTGRQIPDVLQEPLAMPHLSTPAEQPALPHPTLAPPDDGRMPFPAMHQPRINGFADSMSPQDRIQVLLGEIQKAARTSTAPRLKELEKPESILLPFRQILEVIATSYRPSGEVLARQCAEKILASFYGDLANYLEIEALVLLLAKLCQMSELTARDTYRYLAGQEDFFTSMTSVTAALVDAGLIDPTRIDGIISKGLKARKFAALELLDVLFDKVVMGDEPSVLRADLANSLEVMNQWLAEEPSLSLAKKINKRTFMAHHPRTYPADDDAADRTDVEQMDYVFHEWTVLCQNPVNKEAPTVYPSFIRFFSEDPTTQHDEDVPEFLRRCIDLSVASFEEEAGRAVSNLNTAFLQIDAVAKLIVLLVKFQGQEHGAVQIGKTAYLQKTLSLLVLILSQHYMTRGEAFNQRVFFRLFSSILSEYEAYGLSQSGEHADMMLVVARTLLMLQPTYFPTFTYAWMTLITHRAFMGPMLTMTDPDGWHFYRQLIRIMLDYTIDQMKSARFSLVTADMYTGTLRVLLILHKDFPDFICENHQYFCNAIPYHLPQPRNVILSAMPQSSQEWPDPTSAGLKVERLRESGQRPIIAADVGAQMEHLGLKDVVDTALRMGKDLEAAVSQIGDAIAHTPRTPATGFMHQPIPYDTDALTTVVLYVGGESVNSATRGFDAASAHVKLFEQLAQGLSDEGRYYLIGAFVDQVRYPNTHTIFFSNLISHLFAQDTDAVGPDIREQIVRVLVERLACAAPHPWGMLILFLELQSHPKYKFWNQPFLEGAPDARVMIQHLVRSSQ